MKPKTGSDLFIVDNSDQDWKVLRYLHDGCSLAQRLDIATGYFEIGALLGLKDQWQKVDQIRILMGGDVSQRTQKAFAEGLGWIKEKLNDSLEDTKEANDFLTGVPAIVEALRNRKITCRVYRENKFHAKTYITHARQAVIGSFALVGSSNFTLPGLTQNVELNVQITGAQVNALQEWYEEHWKGAEDVTPEILNVIERHTREYSPFEIYAKSLQEFFRGHELTADEWEKNNSKMYRLLASYQRDGYYGMLKRAEKYGGAFLCDGVGLGKTYIGLMLIERLVVRENKPVVLFVPKGARETVWELKIRKYIPHVLGGFLSFRIYNHTDLLRNNTKIQHELRQMREQAEVVIIDEAHHFRNTGIRGEEGEARRSIYWAMSDLCEGKQVYLLTATPVNNRLTDFQHMAELFSRRKKDYFKMAPLGIYSLPGHIRTLGNTIEQAALQRELQMGQSVLKTDISSETNLAVAGDILRSDALFEELVVQRSRSYVKKSLSVEDGQVLFPQPSPPKVIPYSVKQTYGKLLNMVEEAFRKDKPLFSLAMYCPWDGGYYIGTEDLTGQKIAMKIGRQKQVVQMIRTAFLKRFESSVQAFENSCRTLMWKFISFYVTNAQNSHDRDNLDRYLGRNKDITGYDPQKQGTLFPNLNDEDSTIEDATEPEFFEIASEDPLDPVEFNVPGLLRETLNDLETVALFLRELKQFEPKQDKKLQALIQLLRGHLSGLKDVTLQRNKVLIFSEFRDTARYLEDQLRQAGFEDLVEIDSEATTNGRLDIIKAFAPYYNDTSSEELKRSESKEIRILISTDILSEGLNLQDATRLINYDLHWNPVRLMQRIGRIDRRLDPEIEAKMIADHPELEQVRGSVQYYNFLPPDELNELLSLYKTVTHKTLLISKSFGIENGKLLRPEDDYEILRDFIRLCDGVESQSESLSLELQHLLKEHPDLEARLDRMPNKIFSGKENLRPDAKGVFFCYARPAKEIKTGNWTIAAGDVKWYLYDLATEKIIEEPSEIAQFIRSIPATPRHCIMEAEQLVDIRKLIDKHINRTYLKRVNAPIGIKPILKAWMELN